MKFVNLKLQVVNLETDAPLPNFIRYPILSNKSRILKRKEKKRKEKKRMDVSGTHTLSTTSVFLL